MESPAADNERKTPLPGARVALVLLLLINLFNYIDRYVLAAVEEPISKQFDLTEPQMGSLVTAFLITYMLISPIFGFLADRFSRWKLVGIGVLIWSLASGGSGLARGFGIGNIVISSFAMLAFMRCMIGVGEGAYGPVAPTLIADLYPIAIRGKVLSWFYAAIPVGSALGFAVGGLFVHHWRWAFYLTLPPGIILGIWCLFMREPPRAHLENREKSKAKSRWGDYAMLWRIPSYVLNTLAMTAMTFAIGGVAFWMPRYLTQVRQVDEKQARIFFGLIVVVAGLAATLAGGMLGDKLRSKYPGSYFLVSAGGMIAGVPLLLLMLVTPFPYCWGVIFAAVFCLFFNTGPSNTALANVTPPSIRATAFAMNIFFIHALGDAISPPVIGYIARHANWTTAFAAMSAMVLVGGILWIIAARFLGHDTEMAAVLEKSIQRGAE